MSARAARILALTLVVGALILILYAVRLGSRPAAVPAVESLDQSVVLVTTRALVAGETVGASDVAEQPVRVAPPSGFSKLEDVVGRDVVSDLEVGQVLLRRDFMDPGRFHAELGADERAIAVKVDEVIGLGGFAEPGDRVDVLAYFADRSRRGTAQAQLLLEDVRVLAVGSRTEKQADDGRGERARSAVLAVAGEDVPELMLAANTGRLRLALRPGPSHSETQPGAANHRVATLDGLLRGRASSRPKPTPKHKVEVVRGPKKSWIEP